jgi:HlyD family secretion protein
MAGVRQKAAAVIFLTDNPTHFRKAPYLWSYPHPEGVVNDQLRTSQSGPAIGERLGFSASKTKRRIRPWMWWTGGGVLVVAVFIAWGMLNKPKPMYEFQAVGEGALTLSVSATGTLAPRVSVDVGAEVSGRIDELYVDYNDRVTKGQKLAQINTEQIQAQLDAARGTLMQQRATQVQTAAKLKRYTALIKTGDVSQQDFENAKADALRAQGAVAQSTAQVQQYESQLQKCTIYAPIDGVVLDRKVSKGQTVAAAFSTPVLFTLASDLTQMELDVDIDEADVGNVKAGQSAEFTVGAYTDRKFKARLIQVRTNSTTVSNVVTYKGILLVDNAKLLLKPGMTATAEIVTRTLPKSVTVPNAALRFVPLPALTRGIPAAKMEPGMARVWTLESGKLKPHDLKLGGTDGRSTQVVAGDLKPGNKVIVDSAMKSSGGASVSVSS